MVGPAARRALREAQKHLVRADTGTVRTFMSLGPNQSSTVAHYQLSRLSMSSRTTLTSEDGDLLIEAVAVRNDSWVRLSRPEESGAQPSCWIHADPRAIEQTTGLELPSDGSRGVPVGVIVAVNATGLSRLDDVFSATTDLFSAAGAFGGKLPVRLGLDADSKARAPVTITLSGRQLMSWRIGLRELLEAVEAAGCGCRKSYGATRTPI